MNSFVITGANKGTESRSLGGSCSKVPLRTKKGAHVPFCYHRGYQRYTFGTLDGANGDPYAIKSGPSYGIYYIRPWSLYFQQFL